MYIHKVCSNPKFIFVYNSYLFSETCQLPGQRLKPQVRTEDMIMCCMVRAVAHLMVDEYGAMVKL
jgi:hypothetical protein